MKPGTSLNVRELKKNVEKYYSFSSLRVVRRLLYDVSLYVAPLVCGSILNRKRWEVLYGMTSFVAGDVVFIVQGRGR